MPRHIGAFVDYVQVDEDSGCHVWTGFMQSQGYGRYGNAYAHRVAVEMDGREIPPGMQVDHLCRNRACVNPAHLEVVTQRENVLRGYSPGAITARTDMCQRGHELTEANTVREDGYRRCRTCRQAARRARWAAKRT